MTTIGTTTATTATAESLRVATRAYADALHILYSLALLFLYPPYCLWENFFKGSFVRFRGSNPSKTGPKLMGENWAKKENR